MPNRITGAVPSTSQSSDHACFRQRVGPGQAWDATTRRGWVIAAWVLAGRAGSGATHHTARTRGSNLRHRLSRSTNTSTRVFLPAFLPPIHQLEKGCWPGTWGDERGLRRVVGASSPGCRREPTAIRRALTPNASGRGGSALSTGGDGQHGIYPQTFIHGDSSECGSAMYRAWWLAGPTPHRPWF